MLSYRAASAASRRRKLLRSLLKTPPSEEKASNKWVTLEADAESNSKHQKASKHMSWIALILFIFYLGLVYLLSWLERGPDSYFQRPIDPLYFWATTVTTVGFGDILLTRQLTRALAILILPLGLIVGSSRKACNSSIYHAWPFRLRLRCFLDSAMRPVRLHGMMTLIAPNFHTCAL